MIEDDVIRGVRAAREEYARLHSFSIRAMVADLQARDSVGDWPVINRIAHRPQSADSTNTTLQPTGGNIAIFPISKSLETRPGS